MPWLRNRRSRSASSSSLVVTAPPSPVVIAFTGWKEKQHMSERAQLPTGPSGVRGAEGVGGVLDHDPRPAGERGEVDGQAGVVHGDERVDVVGHGAEVEVERGRVDVDEATASAPT